MEWTTWLDHTSADLSQVTILNAKFSSNLSPGAMFELQELQSRYVFIHSLLIFGQYDLFVNV